MISRMLAVSWTRAVCSCLDLLFFSSCRLTFFLLFRLLEEARLSAC